jgi:pyruvate dehydrogenase E2 component (dihydrolipoamide acetyltransferase)
MHEAEIVEWLAHKGQYVRLDQPVVKVETDKAIVEIPSPVAGRISELRFQPGQIAKVGEVLAVYDTDPASYDLKLKAELAHAQEASLSAAPATNGTVGAQRRVLAAPAVRKLAFELSIDLAQITPSAANSRVTLEDVRAYAEQAKAAPPAVPSVPNSDRPQAVFTPASPMGVMSQAGIPTAPTTDQPVKGSTGDVHKALVGLRRQIAEHMQRSWRLIPHATAFDEVDAGGLIALRKELLPVAEKRGVRLTYMPLLVKLLIPVLQEFPIFNASLDEEKREIIYKRSYHLGIATATPEGLLVPVLRDADRLSVLKIAERLEQLSEGAKTRTLALNETHGSTFTLNNIGSFGGSSGTPIINHPEVAILATGRIEEKAVVRSGSIIALPRMPLTLSFDHRLIDGVQAGAFLARFKELVESPQQLLLDMI